MPQPAPKPRFDLILASDFQSRDGGITKGGLVRNGFVERDQDKEPWLWQRPALGTKAAAPLTGAGLGLFFVSTVLWGMYGTGTGTTTSQTVTI